MSARKSIFVTGGASGIGLAAAKLFAQKGWFVGLADVNAAGLKAALETIGRENGATYLLDVRDRAAWDDALSVFTTAAGGKLDVLLNNAGVAAGGNFDEMKDERGHRPPARHQPEGCHQRRARGHRLSEEKPRIAARQRRILRRDLRSAAISDLQRD